MIDGLVESRLGTYHLGHIELGGARTGDRDDRGPRGQVPEHADELQAMDFRHLKIRDDDVDRVSTVFPQSFFPVFSEEDPMTFWLENRAQDHPI